MNCPSTYEFEVTMNDGSPLESFFSYNDGTRTFSINTQDTNDEGEYDLILRIKFTGSSFSYSTPYAFSVRLTLDCTDMATTPNLVATD